MSLEDSQKASNEFIHDSLCVYIGLWMPQGSLESTKNGAKTKDGKMEIIFCKILLNNNNNIYYLVLRKLTYIK